MIKALPRVASQYEKLEPPAENVPEPQRKRVPIS
jgi:hypothetical protein